MITWIYFFGTWDTLSHLSSLTLSEQKSAAPSSTAFEDNLKISTELGSKFLASTPTRSQIDHNLEILFFFMCKL